MKKIGFKNFRRFVELAPLELGEITLMVGKNNSGKSTVVKAILLVLDYLKNQQNDTFSFANEALNDANIVTYKRALNQETKEPYIDFHFEIENFQISIFIWSEDENYTYADVHELNIIDNSIGLKIKIDFISEYVRIIKQSKQTEEIFDFEEAQLEIQEEIFSITQELKKVSKTSREGLRLINQLNKLKEKNEMLVDYQVGKQDSGEVFSQEYPLKDFSIVSTEESVFEEIVSDFLSRNHDMRIFFINKRKEEKGLQVEENEQFEQINGIAANGNEIKKSISELVSLLRTKRVFYLGANPSKQSALFNIRDKENALGQAIHEFYQLKIKEGEPEYLFIENWMKAFDIGNSFEIEFISGEAYECYIVNGKVKTHLADMGMGSLQLMQLLFRIATMIRIYKKETKGINLIVEEPELNLHPSLQSKLADFFHKINDKHGIKFIIETHSEYIIRSSQVIGLENDLFINQETNPNPFKVYYFHIKEGPYEMSFDSRGRFEKEFGEGFTDVSRKLTRKLL